MMLREATYDAYVPHFLLGFDFYSAITPTFSSWFVNHVNCQASVS